MAGNDPKKKKADDDDELDELDETKPDAKPEAKKDGKEHPAITLRRISGM